MVDTIHSLFWVHPIPFIEHISAHILWLYPSCLSPYPPLFRSFSFGNALTTYICNSGCCPSSGNVLRIVCHKTFSMWIGIHTSIIEFAWIEIEKKKARENWSIFPEGIPWQTENQYAVADLESRYDAPIDNLSIGKPIAEPAFSISTFIG